MDFTINTYSSLLKTLKSKYNNFLSLSDYIQLEDKDISACIVRHDVDLNPHNALKIAKIEASLNIRGSYYFRIIEDSYNLDIMKKIEDFNHEIGYHYEDVDLADKNNKGIENNKDLIDLAYSSFCNNLELFKKNFDIKTICMHGSPLSKFDNRMIWDKYKYKELGIIGEPYFDIDFSEFLYLTDTGRRWNGASVSVRDKVNSNYDFNFKNTADIISNIKILPRKIMLTVHPQRWHSKYHLWIKELVFQSIKNKIKKILIINQIVH
tara:strand:+ start:48 stop:842 length:795 start_codon:yes stop_codon:yes gene_type:complete